jgi:hypothetical protein
MKRQRLRIVFLISGVCLVAALGQAISACLAGKLPQAPGEDVLSLVLGDARMELSNALEAKADEYFHGGVRHLDCALGSSAEAHDHENEEHGHENEEHGHEDAHSSAAAGTGLDPWRWIDARVHVQAHQHLKGGQAVEMLPWFWAASRMSPKNAQACESGAYVLAYMLDKPAEAARLLEEGIRKNPAAPELDFMLAQIVGNKLHDAVRAEAQFAVVREKCLAVQSTAERADQLLLLRLRSLFYLGYFARQRGDTGRLRACLEEAEALEPEHQVVRDLRALAGRAGGREP